MSFKWLTVPFSNTTKEISVTQLWEVRWWSREGDYDEDNPRYVTANPELECFVSEKEAMEFKTSLENAFKLLRYSGTGRKVLVRKAK